MIQKTQKDILANVKQQVDEQHDYINETTKKTRDDLTKEIQ